MDTLRNGNVTRRQQAEKPAPAEPQATMVESLEQRRMMSATCVDAADYVVWLRSTSVEAQPAPTGFYYNKIAF